MVDDGQIREYGIQGIFLLIIILLPLQVKNDVYQQIDISFRDRGV